MRLNTYETVACRDAGTRFAQFVNYRTEVIGPAMLKHHIATSRRHRAQKSPCFNAVRHHLVRAAMQAFYALNTNTTAAVAFNLGAHLDQHFGQITDFRLLSRVFKNSFAFSQRRGHQKIFCSCHGDHVCRDAGTFESCAPGWQFGQHVAVLHHNFSAHGLQAFDVLVNWP